MDVYSCLAAHLLFLVPRVYIPRVYSIVLGIFRCYYQKSELISFGYQFIVSLIGTAMIIFLVDIIH